MQENVLKKLNTENESELKLALKLYSFDISFEDFKILLKKTEEPIKEKTIQSKKPSLLKVEKLLSNTRGTLKIVIWSDGTYSFLNRDSKPESLEGISVPWNIKESALWETITEGVYCVFKPPHWSGDLCLAQVTGTKTREDAEKWLSLYQSCIKNREDYGNYYEMSGLNAPTSGGLFTIEDLEKELDRIKTTAKSIDKLEKEETMKKQNALDNLMTIKTKQKKSILTLTALDDHIYTIEGKANFNKSDWLDFVYRHRYQYNSSTKTQIINATFFHDIIRKISSLRIPIKLSVDKKLPVELEFKEIENKNRQKMQLVYLNDKRIAKDDMQNVVFNYFYKGESLEVKETDTPQEVLKREKQRVEELRNQRDNELIEKGITGTLQDLEGETPIQLGFEKEGVSWFLVIGEKRVHLKGGIEAIRSLEKVLTGKALSYSARFSTEEFYNRLCSVLSEEEALEILTTAKELGKLISKIK